MESMSRASRLTVLAGGVDCPYLSGNHDLLKWIGDVGSLVSEFTPGSVPTRHRFLACSRALEAMSDPIEVVEAGALRVTAEAHQLGCQVKAALRPITSATSHGPHELLRTG
ncbi:hypothetical protein HMPREF1531_00034 [Propionibacterium sp. oral taxon 192 str. F0372]|nr:hypothetical protein HMPREF1531_00034 [Propionibacterium sp. oral taxon 192 str. F0372]